MANESRMSSFEASSRSSGLSVCTKASRISIESQGAELCLRCRYAAYLVRSSKAVPDQVEHEGLHVPAQSAYTCLTQTLLICSRDCALSRRRCSQHRG